MESKKESATPDYLKDDFKIRDEFVGAELIDVIKEIAQFSNSLDAFISSKITARAKDDTPFFEKHILSLEIIKRVLSMSDELIILCSELAELEATNPIIANSLRIKRSFPSSFDEQIKTIIETNFTPQSFYASRMRLMLSVGRLKKLSQGIALKILLVEKSFDHLRMLNKMTEISSRFEKDFTIYRSIARVVHQRDLILKLCKLDKTRKSNQR
jgi:hypothetical protein